MRDFFELPWYSKYIHFLELADQLKDISIY